MNGAPGALQSRDLARFAKRANPPVGANGKSRPVGRLFASFKCQRPDLNQNSNFNLKKRTECDKTKMGGCICISELSYMEDGYENQHIRI